MKKELLYALRTAEAAVSGQELCDRLGVSRTAIWKNMNQLKEAGYEIEATTNKGYVLKHCPDSVAAWEVGSRLMDFPFLAEVYGYDSIESTNKTAKELAENGHETPFLVLCEEQTGGRGRRGRSWVSPRNTGIFMTYCLQPDITPAKASVLTLVAGLAVSEAIDEVTGLESQIKWPNDVVIDGKKVCGILTEMSAEPDQISHIEVGIGINVNMESFPEEIAKTATSLKIQSGQTVSRASLVEQITRCFAKYYSLFIETQDMSSMLDIYTKRLVNKDNVVLIEQGKTKFRGIARGINEDGELLVELEDKTMRTVMSGEVSVRGVYGYV
jgi:BirA family biotin operon repressor/biotin-[acetyl-CoA-carboxylase] ligase